MTEFIKLTLLDDREILVNRKYILVISPAPKLPTMIALKVLDEDQQVVTYKVKETFEDIQRMLVG